MKIQKYIPFSFILILFFLSFGKIYADSALVKQYLENLRNSESGQVGYILGEIFYDTTDPLKEGKIKQEYLDLEGLSGSSSGGGTAGVTSINGRDGVVTLTKSDVGLSNVENTALSTWTGSANITSIGTLSSGVVPWARLSGVPNSSNSAAGIVQLNNSLTSTSTVQALTAAQGKILQDTKENLSNKSTSTTLGTSNTLYPTQNAVKTYVDTSIASISSPVTSVNSKTGAVVLTKNDIGLGSVDNTSDASKEVLSATKFTTARTINGVSFNGTANITLPTVNTSGNQTVGGIKTFSSNVIAPNPTASNHLTTKAYVDTMIGSTNSLYEPIFSTGLTTQYLRGDKTWQTLNTTNVSEGTNLYFTNSRAQASITGGASSVATSNLTINRALISDANGKIGVSSVTSTQLGYLAGATSSIQNQLNGKSPLVSPNFTGTPTAPTAVAGTNTTQIATTAFVQGQGFLKNGDLPVTSVNSKTGAVVLTKSDVGLGSVDNTSDASKNVLSATRFTTARTINGVSFNGTANITLPTVNTSGNQTIAGVKTFSSNVIAPNPTASNHLTTKAYVDTIIGTTQNTINKSQYLQSSRDFPNGTLIQTDIDYSVTNGEPWLLEIVGNSYGSAIPFDIKYQGYIYNDTIINHGGISNGTNISGLVAFNYNGKLTFWFPYQSYWQGFNVFINDSYGGTKENRAISIENLSKPTGITKEINLSANIRQSLHSSNYTDYAPTKTGVGASGTWGINVTGNAATATTATRFTTARTINGVSFNGTANITLPTVNTSGNQTVGGIKTFSSFPVTPSSNPTTAYQVANKSYVDGQITSLSLQTGVTSVNSKTGAVVLTKSDVGLGSVDNTSDASKNVLSATRFTTARTINGVSFNGTANITLPTVNTSGNQTIAGVKTFSSTITGNISGNAGTANSSPLLSTLGNYVWNGASLPTTYQQGIQTSFVSSAQGFPEYGSLVNVNTYSGGGGALQLYTPYSPTYGGTGLKVRFGNYDVSGGNSWTSWKTLLASDNYTDYAPTKTGVGASGTWGINVTGNATTATRLATARTIAGVSFNGTANIAIPFANLSTKPTTLAGYGITDAVSTSQVVLKTGVKTAGQFDTTTTAPTNVTRLNYDGYLYATRFYGNGSQLTGITKAQVGLGSVDNTSDLNKPISTATQTALNGKINKAGDTITGKISVGSTTQRQAGIYGIYDSTKIGHIWSMGTSYVIANDGSNFGNLYGLAYKHTNNPIGGTMAGGHQALWVQNGVPTVSLGSGIWTSGNITGNGAGITSINPANISAGTAGISVTGNAATATTATRLTTARTINGVSFNGTANITLPTVNTSGDQTISGIKTFNSAISFPQTEVTNSSTARQWTVPNSLRVLDNYSTTGMPDTYGTVLEVQGRAGHQVNQIYLGSNGNIYNRSAFYNQTSYGPWKTLLDSSNYTDYAPTKTGVGASGTWGINVTGNAATATTATRLTTARTINGVSFNGTANITLPTVNTSGTQTIAGVKTFSNGTIITAGEGTYNAPNFGSSNLGALNIRQTTSDRRNGITFSSAGSANAQAGIYVHQDNSNGTHMYLATTNSYATGPQARLAILNNGNVGVGTTTPSAKLHVVGNIIASNPTASNHVATKAYVDSLAGGGATPVHGTCGTSHYGKFITTPTTGLCNAGSSTSVTYNSTSRRFLWSCNGSNNGANASCYADKLDCSSTSVNYSGTSYLMPFGKIGDTYTIFDNGGAHQCPVGANFVWDVKYVCVSSGAWSLQDNSRCSGSSNEF